jgi:hypothetical protein
MMTVKKLASVADILEREIELTIKEWLRRVKMVPELAQLPLSDAGRTGHLRKLFHDLIWRLRLVKDTHLPVSRPPPRTEKFGGRRATLPPWSLTSPGHFRSPHSAPYISIRANSITIACF